IVRIPFFVHSSRLLPYSLSVPTRRSSDLVCDAPVPHEHRVRVEIEPRGEHEIPFVRARVRHYQPVVLNHSASEEDEVDIERAIPPALIAYTTVREFDSLHRVEELVGRERRVRGGDAVDVPGRIGVGAVE